MTDKMPEPAKKIDDEKEEVLAEYNLDAHGMRVHVLLTRGTDFVPLYNMTYPGIGEATKLLLLSFRRELMSMVPADPTRIEDKEYLEELNNKYIAASNTLIDKYLPNTSGETKRILISYILNMMLGLGDLEGLIADENLEEITVNGSKSPIYVFHKIYGWCKTNIKPSSEEEIYEQSEQIGRRIGREINNLSPLMDAELPDGSRSNSTLFPVSQSGNTITIRKFSKNPWTMPALIKNHSIDPELAALVWLSIQYEISMLFSGGTASGKTSFLNASSIFFPASRRVISIEETRELTLPSFLQWVPMLSRQANPEGKGEVTLYDLMVNALRQRPDIVLIGEIRSQKDAETLFEAIHTGHAVYGTVHADNAQDTIVRMTNPPINIPKIMLNALGAVVVLFRHRSKGIRRVLEFGEVLRDGDVDILYKWDMRSDTFSHIHEMSRLMETLNLYGGLTRSEINDEINEKSKILNWMVKNNVTEVNDAGLVIANYYKHKQRILDIVNDDVKYDKSLFS
ncbi:MAG: type II/IV secretion system ATPase subunit [Candidatus Micrarchaeia archaeon]